MEMNKKKTWKPISRNKALLPLSRQHHHSLLLCWKIRTGFSKGIETHRIKRYSDWFFENHILPHFKEEEENILPILGPDHELVKKVITEHRRLYRLYENNNEVERSLSLIEEELESHIRFEERVLFNKIQEVATNEQLALIAGLHEENEFKDNTEDAFWE